MKAVFDYSYSASDISLINKKAKNPYDFINECEDFYRFQLDMLVKCIKSRPDCRVLLLSGPSSSGKTTTAHKISQILTDGGIPAPVVSMDDFYLGVEHYPKLDDGTPDMEALEALDLPLLESTIYKLINSGSSNFPIFDFKLSKRAEGYNNITMAKNGILVMEGIHALNPFVHFGLDKTQIFRAYISTRTVYTAAKEQVLVPKDTRLIRRISRDYFFRGNDPVKTLLEWKDVLDGEEKYIYPFRDSADFKIDSSLDYEACVFHHYILPLIVHLKNNLQCSHKVLQIIEILEAFDDIDNQLIPQDSLLREFIG
jgi:uridine kinase